MSPEECEAQAQEALERAKKARNPHKALAWLQVAGGWYTMLEAGEPEPEPAPEPQPQRSEFIESLPRVPDEEIRVTIRLADNGHAIVIADPKGKPPLSGRAATPALAAEMALEMLDILAQHKAASNAPPGS